jgi:hypothetical protein
MGEGREGGPKAEKSDRPAADKRIVDEPITTVPGINQRRLVVTHSIVSGRRARGVSAVQLTPKQAATAQERRRNSMTVIRAPSNGTQVCRI